VIVCININMLSAAGRPVFSAGSKPCRAAPIGAHALLATDFEPVAGLYVSGAGGSSRHEFNCGSGILVSAYIFS
jgi:hypothetical protein